MFRSDHRLSVISREEVFREAFGLEASSLATAHGPRPQALFRLGIVDYAPRCALRVPMV